MERPNLCHVNAFLSHRMAVLGTAWISLWLAIAIIGSPLRPDSSPMANDQHLEIGMLSPGTEWIDASGNAHTAWLGTDRYGRDLLSRLMAGSGISLSVGAGSVLISLILGLMIGGLAGYLGGKVDSALSWFLQVMWSFQHFSWCWRLRWHLAKAFGKCFWPSA